MPTVLITGASRGLGLEFAKSYAAEGWRVIATARRPMDAHELTRLGAHVSIYPLDAAEPGSVAALREAVGNVPVDVLIANAGIMGTADSSYAEIDPAIWLTAFKVNSIGPLLLAGAFMANMEAGAQKKLIAISSKMGSIGDNTSGGYVNYRASKAALNMGWRSLAVDVRKRGLIAALLHPGWVKTDMGGPNAAIDKPTSITGMRRVIAGLTMAESGKFFGYDGVEIEW